LYVENKTQCVTDEREGQMKDNLICTILYLNFKLMHFNGSTMEIKANVESYLRGFFKTYWCVNR